MREARQIAVQLAVVEPGPPMNVIATRIVERSYDRVPMVGEIIFVDGEDEIDWRKWGNIMAPVAAVYWLPGMPMLMIRWPIWDELSFEDLLAAGFERPSASLGNILKDVDLSPLDDLG